jgi:hypothetical protein
MAKARGVGVITEEARVGFPPVYNKFHPVALTGSGYRSQQKRHKSQRAPLKKNLAFLPPWVVCRDALRA